jgi:hypothetical protein
VIRAWCYHHDADEPEEIGFLMIAGLMVLLGLPMFMYFKPKEWI